MVMVVVTAVVMAFGAAEMRGCARRDCAPCIPIGTPGRYLDP